MHLKGFILQLHLKHDHKNAEEYLSSTAGDQTKALLAAADILKT
jgi:hypothetical protein